MFTGIIEEIGSIKQIVRRSSDIRMEIQAHNILTDLRVDHSVAINGVCLTAVDIGNNYFVADAVAETLSKTTLSGLKHNDPVNLERALMLHDRLGGHLVQGHVDGVATIRSIQKSSEGGTFAIELPFNLNRYTIEKGSIAIDGVSLTIAEKKERSITIAVIPHTWQKTIVQYKRIGDSVNIEVDFFAKYIEQFLNQAPNKNKITSKWLTEQGFY